MSPAPRPRPVRVVFDADAKGILADEIKQLGCARAVIVTVAEFDKLAQELAAQIGSLCAGVFAEAESHTPVAVTDRAAVYVRRQNADCLVALGGSTAVGLSKALALRTHLHQIALPMSFSGAEVTAILNETVSGLKTQVYTLAVLPDVILYDVSLTLVIHTGAVLASGLIGMAHAVEALYAPDRTPAVTLMAEEGIRIFAKTLPAIHADPLDMRARARAMHGAWLCGSCLNTASTGLHHRLCEILGGSFRLSHFNTHAVMLPYTIGYNAAAAPDAMRRIAENLGTKNAAKGMYDFTRRLTLPPSLAAIGFKRDQIERAAELVVANPILNPRPLRRSTIRALLDSALAGEPPPWPFEE
ncbi:maleylacetate reductase [Methylovirgula sp. 4M-Z18]|uniref:maleylacetate reductase n=1 Tax=Methylovirgula sp. 4M-Z18 TaxID=2293567 RepID=UPI001AECB375|nr:maleylacetate reductase [Methylovirgula sp. 4M-Z18]